MMREELKREYSQFLCDIKDGAMTFGIYIDETEYQYEYSLNEISDCQREFIQKVRDYLHENFPRKYVVKGGWGVFVMTVEEAKRMHVYCYEDYIA